VGDQRQMRPSIKVFPAQGDIAGANRKSKNFAGTKDYSLADIYSGIIRNIEYSSSADIAYDTAFEHCAGWGLGYFRVLTDYADYRSFDQEFLIKRIRNYKSVLLDPDFQEPDGSDSQYGFIFSKLHKDDFEKRYPGKNKTNIDYSNDQFELWADGDFVYVAEYYYLKDHTYHLNLLTDGRVIDADEMEPIRDELAREGVTVARSRTVKGKKCCWAKISANEILDGEKDTVFSWVPVIPVLGKELVVEGTPHYRGAIRHSKDAQRMYNYSRSADIERTALIPKVPYIIADKQVEGYENTWASANTTNFAYLPYKHIEGVQKPGRESPVTTNPGEQAQSMMASDDIKATSGMFDASLGAQGNETSGKAIMARQREGDVGSYAFSDNMVRSIRHLGRILLDAIPKLYDTERLVRLRFPDDSEDFVEINKTIVDEQTNKTVIINDLSVGKFDLVVKAGPSYSTQRMEAADTITQFIQAVGGADPIVGKALTMLAAKNMDWPESDKVVEIIKKSLPPGLIDEPPEDGEEEPPPPPTPEEIEQLVMQQVEQVLDSEENQAKMAKAQADKATAEAKMTEALARIEEFRSGEGEDKSEEIRDLVAEALAEFMSQVSK
jgi:hypothetical protein